MRSKISGLLDKLFLTVGIVFIVYLSSTIISLFQEASEHYTTFVLGVILLTGLITIRNILNSKSQGIRFWLSLAVYGTAALACLAASIYLRVHAVRLETIQPFIEPIDIQVGWVMLGSLLVLTFYHWGSILTLMIAAAMAYFFAGHLIPSPLLQHEPFSSYFAMSYMGMSTTSGIFWMVPLASDKIFFLIIFASLLIGVGMLPLVMEVGKWMGQYIRGGAAFPAIFGSAMTGSVMGQAVSNTMLTGRLTIPMMKRNGFSSELAGAIEAVASTSGQLLPPILGMAAFIIAAFLNIAYIKVALSATLPALLYISGVTICVLTAARVLDLGYLTEKVDKMKIIRLFPSFAVGFGSVLVLLLLYYSPNIAALVGIAGMLAVAFCQGRKYRPTLRTLRTSLHEGLDIVTVLCLLLIAIGPIAQMATTTNLAGKLSSVLANSVPNSLMLVLLGTMVVSLVLGMGLPTPVAYLVVALTTVSFLQEFGLPSLVAHMFVFYFAVYSTISPPVAISCLAAAKISGGTFFGTAYEAMKISLPTFIIPFVFVYNPELLAFPQLTANGTAIFLLTILIQYTMAIALYGFIFRKINWLERLVFAAVCLGGLYFVFTHDPFVLAVTAVIGIGLIVWIFMTRKSTIATSVTEEAGALVATK
jgi:TRAP transporter 4TM/12TM fusion protein